MCVEIFVSAYQFLRHSLLWICKLIPVCSAKHDESRDALWLS